MENDIIHTISEYMVVYCLSLSLSPVLSRPLLGKDLLSCPRQGLVSCLWLDLTSSTFGCPGGKFQVANNGLDQHSLAHSGVSSWALKWSSAGGLVPRLIVEVKLVRIARLDVSPVWLSRPQKPRMGPNPPHTPPNEALCNVVAHFQRP